MNKGYLVGDLGFGIGLRQKHFAEVLKRNPAIGFFEVMSEEFLQNEGWSRYVLEQVSERYPIVMHGVSLSIGGTDPLNVNYLKKLRELANKINARWISDHLCWTGVDGVNTHNLLPLPLTEETLEHVKDRVHLAQDTLGRRLVLENPASYLAFSVSSMPEWEFLGRLVDESGCQLLLDVNNVYVSASHNNFEASAYIDALTPGSVIQIHLAGHQGYGKYFLDTHSTTVSDAVWTLYAHACSRLGPISTLVEWDIDIPELPVLEAELRKAAEVRRTACLPTPNRQRPTAHFEPKAGAPRKSSSVFSLRGLQQAVQGEVINYTPASGKKFGSMGEAASPDVLALCSPPHGIQIYAQNYKGRILEMLQLTFPVLRDFVGDMFTSMAQDFIQKFNPNNVKSDRLFLEFLSFIDGFKSADSHSNDLMVQVATFDIVLERARSGAGVEGRQTVHENDIVDIPAELITHLRFEPNPSLVVLALDDARLLKAFSEQARVAVEWSGKNSMYIALFRINYTLRAVYLDILQYILLNDILKGYSAQESKERHGEAWAGDHSRYFASVRQWYCTWASLGFFARIL